LLLYESVIIARNKNYDTMKKLIVLGMLVVGAVQMNAQVVQLEGPRFGVSYISEGSTSQILQRMYGNDSTTFAAANGGGATMTTQYGWQWEKRFADNGGDIVGLVEWVVLVAGMEKGLFLPSLTTLVGVRSSSGFEFGTGPNLSLSGLGFVFAVGYNLRTGDLNFPINISFVPDKTTKGSSDLARDLFKFHEDFNDDLMTGAPAPNNILNNTGYRMTLSVGFNFN